MGPTLKNHWYQAETGYDWTHFSIDWDAQVLICPQGRSSASWTPAHNRKGNPVIKVKFSQTDCKACPSQADCTSSTRRTLTLQPRQQMEALIAARQREGTADFKELYRHWAGIEGVHSQATRMMGCAKPIWGMWPWPLRSISYNLPTGSEERFPPRPAPLSLEAAYEANSIGVMPRLRHRYQNVSGSAD